MSDKNHVATESSILVVTDDPQQMELLCSALKQHGYSFTPANQCDAAIAQFEHSHFDLIIIDTDIIDHTDCSFASAISQQALAQNIPIILITTRENIDNVIHVYNSETSYFVFKPVIITILIHRVGYLLKTSNTLKALHDSEQSLARSEARYRGLLEASSDWVWETDENLRFSYFSHGLDKISPLASPSALGKTRDQLVPQQDLSKPKWKQHLQDLNNRKPFKNFEYEFKSPDGNNLHYRVSGSPIFDESGRFLGYRGTGSDITKQIADQQLLTKARDEATRANQAKSLFLSSMSHELRTPLNAIMGFGQLLQDDEDFPLQEYQRQYTEEILKASNHMLKLIDQVLDLSKIESGHMDFHIRDESLAEILFDTIQLLATQATKKNLPIQLHIEADDISIAEYLRRSHVVRVDYTRLKQVLVNLLGNAVKYNRDNGSIDITLRQMSDKRIRVEVTDTGKGLSQQQQEHLFESFNRLGAETSGIEGSGIGLVISKNIIERLDGSIGVKSEIDRGTTFWVEIPLAEADETAHREPTALMDKDLTEMIGEKSILYIEDSPISVKLIRTFIDQRLPQLKLLTAASGRQGLQLAETQHPDLILLDINLPDMDGFEVLHRLHGLEHLAQIPVVGVSAMAMHEDIKKAFDVGFDDYLVKPIDLSSLLKIIKSHLIV